ncbi:hypothetical protein [Streptomyces malaysiensis]|uniref:hypothetical protein n=1 Tax=Streptomyces malaysiensis TaxID=92644 RepID=UPI0022B25365|nr:MULTISPECIES: hypothetical protein [unclassified Streptomyces]
MPVEALDDPSDLRAPLDVDAGQLVEDEQAGAVHEGPREDEAPLHAAGEFVGAYVGLVVEAEHGEQFVGAPGGRLPADAVVSGVVDQDLPDGQEPVDVDLLRGQTQQPGAAAQEADTAIPQGGAALRAVSDRLRTTRTVGAHRLPPGTTYRVSDNKTRWRRAPDRCGAAE